MNPTLQAIQERFSCRSFTGAAPSPNKVQAIAQAAIQAPSAMNRQPWQVIVVQDRDLIAELEAEGTRVMAAMPDQTLYQRIQSRGGKLFYNTPCIFFVPIQPDDLAAASLDCGIVCQTIALAAQSLGLASCICGLTRLAFSEEKEAYFKKKLQFPAGYEFGAAILVGEAAAKGSPHEPDSAKITLI